ncbi:MAG: hypothetical protein KJ607_01325 [Bacteroidetes bacterium]|nr:hypothetical protein [Bacteroidota bacterium]
MTGRKEWDGRTKAGSSGIRFFMILIRYLGIYPAYFTLLFVAAIYTLIDAGLRRNLRAYRNRLGLTTDIFNIYGHTLAFGHAMIDRFAYLLLRRQPFRFTGIGEEQLVEALQKQKGLIILAAHIGNQEVSGDVLYARIRTRVNYLMLDNEKSDIRKVIEKASGGRNVNIIPTNADDIEMALKVKQALENNEIVCMLGDRVMGNESFLEIPFLGKNARYPTYPFEIAALTGSPVITTSTVKTGLRSYRFRVFDYIPFDNVSRSNRKAYIREAMQKYVAILEKIVTEYPRQWFNFYDYWEEFS